MQENHLFEIALYLIAPLFMAGVVYFLINKYLDREYRLKMIELKRQMQSESFPLRMQAYERLVLFLERISPNNIFQRAISPDMNCRELQLELINIIRSEFDHNLTQQIYVSAQSWGIVRNAKEEMIRIINSSSDSMNPNGPAFDLSKAIFETMLRNEEFPTQKAIDVLKQEVALLF